MIKAILKTAFIYIRLNISPFITSSTYPFFSANFSNTYLLIPVTREASAIDLYLHKVRPSRANCITVFLLLSFNFKGEV